MNQNQLIGRVTKDIELKETSNGKQFCNFTLAVPKKIDRTKAAFIPVIAWGKTAENCVKYAKKGAQIGITGYIDTYVKDVNGQKTTIVQVVAEILDLLGSKKDSDSGSATDEDSAGTMSEVSDEDSAGTMSEVSDDDVPW